MTPPKTATAYGSISGTLARALASCARERLDLVLGERAGAHPEDGDRHGARARAVTLEEVEAPRGASGRCRGRRRGRRRRSGDRSSTLRPGATSTSSPCSRRVSATASATSRVEPCFVPYAARIVSLIVCLLRAHPRRRRGAVASLAKPRRSHGGRSCGPRQGGESFTSADYRRLHVAERGSANDEHRAARVVQDGLRHAAEQRAAHGAAPREPTTVRSTSWLSA